LTYGHVLGRAKASTAVKPVIVTELVNLDTLLVRLVRLRLCHHRRCRRPLSLTAEEEWFGLEREALLPDGELGVGQAENSKSRHLIGRLSRDASRRSAGCRVGAAMACSRWRLDVIEDEGAVVTFVVVRFGATKGVTSSAEKN